MNRLGRRYRTWKRARARTPERCETCHQPTRKPHEVTELADVEDHEIAMWGGSSVSAIFCPAHCPGGCDHQHKEPRHATAA